MFSHSFSSLLSLFQSPDVTPQPKTTPHKPPSGRSHVKSPLPLSNPHTKVSIPKQSTPVSKPHPPKSDTDRASADSKSSSTTRLDRSTASPVGMKRSSSKTRVRITQSRAIPCLIMFYLSLSPAKSSYEVSITSISCP